MRPTAEAQEDRFLGRITVPPNIVDDCWLWGGPISSSTGYGSTTASMLTGKTYDAAHRVSWVLFVGEIPSGLCVLHRCDVRGCVNPAHLFLGTKGDNIRDCVAKGRYRHHGLRGEAHASSKVTLEQVKEMRRAYAAKEATLAELGKRFGIGHTQVSNIVRGAAWAST